MLQRVLLLSCVSFALACSVDVDGDDPVPDGGSTVDGQGHAGSSGRGGGGAGNAASAGKGGGQTLDDGGRPIDNTDGSSPADTDDASTDEPSTCMTCAGCDETITIASAGHVTGDIDYADKPPAGGDHNECWGSWGVHDTALRAERWVHNLEHGGVVFLYHCPDGCADDVAKLEALVQGKVQAMLTPYDDMPNRFAVVSWGHRLKTECFDEAVFQAFYTAHVDLGPESITSGPPTGCPAE